MFHFAFECRIYPLRLHSSSDQRDSPINSPYADSYDAASGHCISIREREHVVGLSMHPHPPIHSSTHKPRRHHPFPLRPPSQTRPDGGTRYLIRTDKVEERASPGQSRMVLYAASLSPLPSMPCSEVPDRDLCPDLCPLLGSRFLILGSASPRAGSPVTPCGYRTSAVIFIEG